MVFVVHFKTRYEMWDVRSIWDGSAQPELRVLHFELV